MTSQSWTMMKGDESSELYGLEKPRRSFLWEMYSVMDKLAVEPLNRSPHE